MKKLLLILACCLMLSGCAGSAEPVPEETTPISAAELVEAMGIGWNLGNSFDAPGGETAWANPVTGPELIARVKELGFDTIRIPVSWGKHVSGAPAYRIDPAYLERVAEVVGQALDNGLYVIIDAHHDNDIYHPLPENREQGIAYLTAVWSQVAERFKDADEHLIFQTMNEPRIEGASYEWGLSPMKKSHQEILGVINDLNQAALDAIRAAGGKNEDRFVLICPYAGKLDSAANAFFRMPQDSAQGRLLLSVHIYSPYNFCMNLDKKYNTFTDDGEIGGLLKTIDMWFLQKGIPVIVDEMGCTEKNNPEARHDWAKLFVTEAKAYGIPCIWWDNGYLHGSGDNFGMINRRTLELYPESVRVYEGLMESFRGEYF